MEKQFFEWDSWDEIDTAVFQFYNCKMVSDIPGFKIGDEIDTVVVDYEKGMMEFYDDENVIATFSLKLTAIKIETKQN